MFSSSVLIIMGVFGAPEDTTCWSLKLRFIVPYVLVSVASVGARSWSSSERLSKDLRCEDLEDMRRSVSEWHKATGT